jgi:hypothetical protein
MERRVAGRLQTTAPAAGTASLRLGGSLFEQAYFLIPARWHHGALKTPDADLFPD